MDKIKIILDCDTGHDDAIALMIAAKHPQIDLLGITVVNGNAPLPNTLINTLNVVQRLNLDVKVYGGMDRPLVRERLNAPNIHGDSGLDGPVFAPLQKKAEDKHAVLYLIDTLMNSDGDITLVPVGPLTNIAMAMRLQPAICQKIKRISLMGGAYGLGNISPAAEFNFLADPEAADIVFRSGVNIVMMGLDITNTALATLEVIERMEALNNEAGKLFGEIMRYTLKTQHDCYDLEAGPVHDVLAVSYLVRPDLFEMKPMNVQIDIDHGISYGRSVADYYHCTGLKENALVGISLKRDEFWDFVEETLKRY